MKFRSLTFFSLFLLISAALVAQPLVQSLQADYKTNPMGIDNPKPMLSWIIQSDQMNTMQDSYEIRAALNSRDVAKGKNLVWESGKVESSQSIHVKYGRSAIKILSADLLAGEDQRQLWQVQQME